jgi:hypothetical protein
MEGGNPNYNHQNPRKFPVPKSKAETSEKLKNQKPEMPK